MNESVYPDFLAEFSSIKGTMQKKLLKKPNLHDSLKQFRELATALEDAEMLDQAGYCHKEIAAIFERLENPLMERRHLLKAANLFRKALIRKQKKMHLIFSTELLQLIEECYLVVIERVCKQESPRIAGLTYLELAKQFELLEEFSKSYAVLIKANRFLQGDIYSQITIIEKMADLMPKQPIPENALTELQAIWNSFSKSQIDDAIIPILLALEGRILLLQLFHSMPNIPHLVYDGQWRTAYGKSSIAGKEIFLAFSQFIGHLRQQNYFKAAQLYSLELEAILDAKGRKLCKSILEELHFSSISCDEFNEILESNGMNEIQKRIAMFELNQNHC